MLLGALAILTGITLFQPHRLTKNPIGMNALRGVGCILAVVTVWAAWYTVRRIFISN